MDQYGFPRTKAKSGKVFFGFRTGDLVRAVVATGKKIGTYIGKVAVRATGYFNIATKADTIQGISHSYCEKVYAADGYTYN